MRKDTCPKEEEIGAAVLQAPGDSLERSTDTVPACSEDATCTAGFVFAWDPAVVTEEQYADLIGALGDLARSEGAIGIERVRTKGLGVTIGQRATV